tara:strand:- start:523 stop:1272 length:750 start_codon:yes stop_codon:yes gene_type:complete
MSFKTTSVNIELEPDNKENAWNNIFNMITILWLLGYIGYQFYIEWSNWDSYESTFNNTWRINVADAVEAQTMRLTRICKNEALFEQIFYYVLGATGFYSLIKFICRQSSLLSASLNCETGIQWFLSLILYGLLLCVQADAAFFTLSLMLPSTFMVCYEGIAKYYCTILFGSIVGQLILSAIIAVIGKPILNYKVKYTGLVRGSNGEIEVTQKRSIRNNKRFANFKDNKDEEVEVYLDDDDDQNKSDTSV